MENDQRYAESIIRPLLTIPDAFTINRSEDDRGILLTVSVAKADMGRMIGKEGQTARCIRHLVHQFGSGEEHLVSVKINEPTE
jgi:predicted RNA-binding protein YlqC (UPF0109 family)